MSDDCEEDFAQTKTYYCNFCNTKLSYNGKEPNTRKNEWLCTKCNIAFYPANELVRKANKFETPGELEPLNATVDSDDNATTKKLFSFCRFSYLLVVTANCLNTRYKGEVQICKKAELEQNCNMNDRLILLSLLLSSILLLFLD